MNDKLLNYFNSIDNTKISHSFLIANAEYNEIEETLNKLFSKLFFHLTLETKNNLDVFVVKPENNLIKKEKIEEIQKFINNTSQISDKKVYIIDHCECLNKYSANSLLKTLEEPNNNVYAFLITSNFNNVLSTIRSRCQHVFISTSLENKLNFEQEEFDIAFDIINLIETKHINALPFCNKFFGKKVEKEKFNQILNAMMFIYHNMFNMYYKKDAENKINEKIKVLYDLCNKTTIITKMKILEECNQNLNKNLNLLLVIDKLLLDLGGTK